MKNLRIATAGVATGVLLSLTGCLGLSTDPRTSNQGGGDLISAGLKAAQGQIASLTPDEIQVASDFAIQQTGVDADSMTDEQAAAVSTFLKDNNLNRVEDFEALQANPENVVVAQEVQDAVEMFLQGLGEDFSFDEFEEQQAGE
ncbi:MAG: hypothetical protein AB7N71_11355 [Phycisphaerae bacterium]